MCFIFSVVHLYTNPCTSTFPNRHFIKYGYDTDLVSLLFHKEEEHGPVLNFFLDWCEKSNLLLNTSKTKKIMLMMLIDKLKWAIWTDRLNAKSQQRMSFLRKLLSFNVSSRMLQTFYCAFIESILFFGIICWFCNATETQKKAIRRIITTSSKLSRISFPSTLCIYRDNSRDKQYCG